ncbi:FAD binding domain-containing protein [Streptomyces sp. NBC_01006]|uniref:FAD binding domain-containing protein n=1 Tax=Streptomyces sp. NBC_01006 TaxID=2903716 RepID=UPI00386D5192|nr:xanthine dehydrogenase family protein subunit M [Streptomyces sp. NBC_01006]
MKPAAFDYQVPRTLDEALALLAGADRPAVPLAGGQSLVPLLNQRRVRPATVVDLNRVAGLAGIRVTADSVRVGAMTRLSDVEADPALTAALPVLAHTAGLVAHRQIRHRSTLGGSLCHADPAGQLPACVVALGARLTLHSTQGARTLDAEDFFQGPHLTARRPGELLTAVAIPRRPGFRHRFEEVSRRGSAGRPLVGVCLAVAVEGPVVVRARLAASGIADRPVRLREAERALVGQPPGTSLSGVLDAASAAADPPGDLHGSAAYRTDMLRTALRRAVTRLVPERNAA